MYYDSLYSGTGNFVQDFLSNPNAFNVGALFGTPVGYDQPSALSFMANSFNGAGTQIDYQQLLAQSLSQGAVLGLQGVFLANGLIGSGGGDPALGSLALASQAFNGSLQNIFPSGL